MWKRVKGRDGERRAVEGKSIKKIIREYYGRREREEIEKKKCEKKNREKRAKKRLGVR